MEIRTIGIDLEKTVFQLIGVNALGGVVVHKKWLRKQLLRTSKLRKCLIGMEACGGSHFLGRALREQGHEVRLMPVQYVKPYVKTNKNDYIDAGAIAEAVTRCNELLPRGTPNRLVFINGSCVEYCPVGRLAAGLQSQSTTAAISSGLPARWMGTFFAISSYALSFPLTTSRAIWVSMSPGLTAFT